MSFWLTNVVHWQECIYVFINHRCRLTGQLLLLSWLDHCLGPEEWPTSTWKSEKFSDMNKRKPIFLLIIVTNTCTCTLQPQLQSMTPILLHLSGQSVVGWRDGLGNKTISSLMWTLISILIPNRFNHGLMAAGRLLLECRVTYSDRHWALRLQFLCLFTVRSHTTKN